MDSDHGTRVLDGLRFHSHLRNAVRQLLRLRQPVEASRDVLPDRPDRVVVHRVWTNYTCVIPREYPALKHDETRLGSSTGDRPSRARWRLDRVREPTGSAVSTERQTRHVTLPTSARGLAVPRR